MRTVSLYFCVCLAILFGAAAASSRIPFLRSDLARHVVFKDDASLIGGRGDVWPGAPDFFSGWQRRMPPIH